MMVIKVDRIIAESSVESTTHTAIDRQFWTGRLKNVTFIPLFLDIFQDMNRVFVSKYLKRTIKYGFGRKERVY